MFYSISGLCPTQELSGAGFIIKLWPAFREAAGRSQLTQENVDHVLNQRGRQWLDGCGYDRLYDPDNCGHLHDPKKPPGPRARPLYQPGLDLRATWGEWGLEHITVPGNACGLDLDRSTFHAPWGGRVLTPHNVDTIRQAHLMLVVFTFFADYLTMRELTDASE